MLVLFSSAPFACCSRLSVISNLCRPKNIPAYGLTDSDIQNSHKARQSARPSDPCRLPVSSSQSWFLPLVVASSSLPGRVEEAGSKSDAGLPGRTAMETSRWMQRERRKAILRLLEIMQRAAGVVELRLGYPRALRRTLRPTSSMILPASPAAADVESSFLAQSRDSQAPQSSKYWVSKIARRQGMPMAASVAFSTFLNGKHQKGTRRSR